MYVYSILIWIKDIKTKIKAPHYWTWNLPRLCRASLTLKWLERSHFHFHMRRRQLCIGSSTQIPTIYLQVQQARARNFLEKKQKKVVWFSWWDCCKEEARMGQGRFCSYRRQRCPFQAWVPPNIPKYVGHILIHTHSPPNIPMFVGHILSHCHLWSQCILT